MTARRTSAALAVLALSGAALAGGASATSDPTFASSRTFFHCGAKVGNVGSLSGGVPSWNTTAPTGSFTAGAGCGSTNPPAVGNAAGNYTAVYDTIFTGTYTGNIKDLTLELHSIYAGTGRATGQVGVTVSLLVDGREYKPAAVIAATAVPSATRLSEKVTFTLTDLNVVDDLDEDGVPDAGGGTTAHSISIKLRNAYIDGNPVGAFVYDATEVPAGITFNPATPEAAVAKVS